MEISLDIEELKWKLDELKVPKRYYSINGEITPNTYILQQVYSYWEYYYVDERGGQNEYRRFDNEDEACGYFLGKLEFEMSH